MRIAALLLSVALLAIASTVSADAPQCPTSCVTKVLFWGATPAREGGQTIVEWLNTNIPSVEFDQLDPATNNLTAALLSQYQLVVLSQLTRPAFADEASALWTWIENGGNFFGMSGWSGDSTEIGYSNSYFANFDGQPMYFCAPGNCYVSGCTNFYPNQPLLAGISNCNVDYVGGFASQYAMSYSGTDTFSYLFYTMQGGVQYNVGLQVNLCGADHPNGGRMVFWGDEWISYTPLFTSGTQDQQLWFNILNYLSVCVPQCTSDSDCGCGQTCSAAGTCVACTNPSCGTGKISPDCSSAYISTSMGQSVTLTFDSSVSTCGSV